MSGEMTRYSSSYGRESFNGVHSSCMGYWKYSTFEPDWLRFGYHPTHWPIATAYFFLRDWVASAVCSQIPPCHTYAEGMQGEIQTLHNGKSDKKQPPSSDISLFCYNCYTHVTAGNKMSRMREKLERSLIQ